MKTLGVESTVRTIERELTPQSKGEFVKTPGIGSGVLISADGKVLTAAHIVQAADRVVVEFTEGKEIPAEVIASAPTADVALLKLEWVPIRMAPPPLPTTLPSSFPIPGPAARISRPFRQSLELLPEQKTE